MAFFDNDELIQTWVVHHLQIIGEASSNLSAAFREKYLDIKWPEVIAMRNLLVHEYFGINLDEIWATVINDLPKLGKKISQILGE